MMKELKLNLRRLNYVVLKKIVERRGKHLKGSKDNVEIGEMEQLLTSIQSTKKKTNFLLYFLILFIASILLLLGTYYFNLYEFKTWFDKELLLIKLSFLLR